MPQLKKGFPKFPLLDPPIRGDLDAQSGGKILQKNPDRTLNARDWGPPTPRGRGGQVSRKKRAFRISGEEF